MRISCAAAAMAALLLATPGAVAADAPVEVIVVGGFHMSNPGQDLHNVQVGDVLQPKYQAQIEAVTDALARFHPTAVAVEWPADTARERYAKYLAGTLAPSRNEVVQLGFRLAKEAGLSTVHGIDVDGDFPYEAVDAYARAHGKSAILERANATIQAITERQTQLIANESVGAALRYLNDPSFVAHGNDFYRDTLRIGSGTAQPGAELMTAWYRRNFLICANLVQMARPGDRIVVFYGSGHTFLLRQCVAEMPGFKLVEANDYLPR